MHKCSFLFLTLFEDEMVRKKTKTCSGCGQKFARPENLTEHVRVAHSVKVEKLVCPLCTEFLSNVTNLRKHIGRIHTQKQSFLTNIGGVVRWKGKRVKHEYVDRSQLYKGRFIGENRENDDDSDLIDDSEYPPSKKRKRVISSDSIGDNGYAYRGDNDEYLAEISPIFVAVKGEYAESVDYEISTTETIDTIEESELSISSFPQIDGKTFLNIAKGGFTLDSSDDAKADWKAMTKKFEPLNKWLIDVALKGLITKVVISEHVRKWPCSLGWIGK